MGNIAGPAHVAQAQNGHEPAAEFACIPASRMLDLVEAFWEPTWEPAAKARLLEYEPHFRLVQEYRSRADFLIGTPSRCDGRMMWMVVNLPGSSKAGCSGSPM